MCLPKLFSTNFKIWMWRSLIPKNLVFLFITYCIIINEFRNSREEFESTVKTLPQKPQKSRGSSLFSTGGGRGRNSKRNSKKKSERNSERNN